MTGEALNILAGLEGDDLARARASQQNALNIVAQRRRMAAALLAKPQAKIALDARWAAILHPDKATPPAVWGPSPDGTNYWHGHGAPAIIPDGAKIGDIYVDDDTELAYRLETP